MNEMSPIPAAHDDDLASVIIEGIKRHGGDAAREHLAAGRPIYYWEDDTPEGLSIKEYPDGKRELVRHHRDGDDLIRLL